MQAEFEPGWLLHETFFSL